MKRSRPDFERENDEKRKQEKTYVDHGGMQDNESPKTPLFEQIMDVTEDMFKIPEV